MVNNAEYHQIPLPGLNGANPLAFLAALGVMRILTQHDSEYKTMMSWNARSAYLSPIIHTSSPSIFDESTLTQFIIDKLKSFDDHYIKMALDFYSDNSTHNLSKEIHNKNNSIYDIGWLSALGSSITDSSCNNQLQTVRTDYFEGNIKSIIQNTDDKHIKRALFQSWDYGDALNNQSLHWDPSEDRRHALQWDKPSGDPNRKESGGMLGANRLGFEAIPLFTSFPFGDKLQTIGFTGNKANNTYWTWPIWKYPIQLHTIKSIMTMPDIHETAISPKQIKKLKSLGIHHLYRSRRILVGKTPNLTPSVAIA